MNLIIAVAQAEPLVVATSLLWAYLSIIYLFFGVPLLAVVALVAFLFSACFPAARVRLRSSSLVLGCFAVANVVVAYSVTADSSPVFAGLWLVALWASPILFFASALLPRPKKSADTLTDGGI